MTTPETIDHSTLSKLVEAGAVRGAHVIGQSDCWAVLVRYGLTERLLAAQRSRKVRLFRKLETLVSYLKDVGIAKFDVDAENYDPNMLKAARRPDRSEALKRTHEAAAYDVWFRAQVQASTDDPRPDISDSEARAKLAARKDALRRAR